MKSKFAIAIVPLLLLTGIVQPPAQAAPGGLTPTFATPIATASPTGFTVQISNYDSSYSWAGTASPSGSVSINGTGLVTFLGPASTTVTITTTKDGNSGSQTIGLCVGTAPISISTSSQALVDGDILTVNFNKVGKFCGAGNFKMITASSPAINGQGFLDSSASTQDLSISANRSGTQSQTVTYTRTITSTDEMKFFQFYFVTTAGAVTKTTSPVKVFPADYHEPQDAVVTVSIEDGYQLPYYFSNDTGISAFGDLSRFTHWYNCGAPSSPDGMAAIADPTIADTTCDYINSGGYNYIRGDLTSDGPTNISNSVLVSRLEVTDVFGSSSPFYSAAVTTPEFEVTSVSTNTAYVGGGETITVNGTGLTKSTILWSPNVGGDTLLGATTVSDNRITFTVPAPRTRAATSATISIRTAGGEIAGPSSITLTKATVATLSNLSLSVGTLSPTFSAEETSYTATVPLGTTSMTVTPTFTGTGQTVTVNSSSVASGAASGSINLNLGSNVITIVGTAEDGTTTKTYTVTVTRPNPPTLSTPTLTASTPIGSSNTIDLSWTAVTNRSSYTVKIYFAEDLDSVIRTIANVTDTTLTISSSNFPSIGIRALYKISVTAIGDGENHLTSLESTKVSAATGSVSTTFTFSGTTITSSAFEGRSVAANISDIRSGGSYAYKWFGGSDANSLTEISGAISSSYTPTASDRSLSTQKYLSVRVVATISGNTYTFRSTAIPVYTYPNATGGSVTAPSPAARGTYTSGKYKVGQTVIGHPWQVMGTPWPTLTYQWYVCNTAAAAATPAASCTAATGDGNSGTATRGGSTNDYDLPGHGFSYVVPEAAAGKFLTFTATLSNEATTARGTVFTFTQSRIQHSGIIQTTPGITGTLSITGTPRVGRTLRAASVTATTVNSNPTGTISYQWQRCTSTDPLTCSNIAGATRTTYTTVNTDLGKYLRVVATATNKATTPDSTTATSAMTGVVTN